MAKIAMRNVVDSLLAGTNPVHDITKDLVVVVGKGYGSEAGIRILLPAVQNLLECEYSLKNSVDSSNIGRLVVKSQDLMMMLRGKNRA